MPTVAGVSVRTGVQLTGVQQTLIRAVAYYPNLPQVYVTSGLRDTSDYHGRGWAADFGFGGVGRTTSPRGVAFAQWMWQYRNYFLEFIHRNAFNRSQRWVKLRPGRTASESLLLAHENHIHLAATPESLALLLQHLERQARVVPLPPPAPIPAPTDSLPTAIHFLRG